MSHWSEGKLIKNIIVIHYIKKNPIISLQNVVSLSQTYFSLVTGDFYRGVCRPEKYNKIKE